MEEFEGTGFLRETKLSRKKSWGTLSIFILGQLVLGGFLAIFLIFGLGMEEQTANSWLNFLIFGTFTLIFILMHRRQFKLDWQRKGPFGKFAWKVLKWWGLLLLLSFAANLILIFLLGIEEMPGNQELIVDLASSYPALMIITTVLFAPFVEEVVFRLALMKLLEKRPWLAITASSLIFGLLHVIAFGDYIFLISYAAMGFPFAYSYFKTGNIWIPTAVHIIHNLYAITMTLIVAGGL